MSVQICMYCPSGVIQIYKRKELNAQILIDWKSQKEKRVRHGHDHWKREMKNGPIIMTLGELQGVLQNECEGIRPFKQLLKNKVLRKVGVGSRSQSRSGEGVKTPLHSMGNKVPSRQGCGKQGSNHQVENHRIEMESKKYPMMVGIKDLQRAHRLLQGYRLSLESQHQVRIQVHKSKREPKC